MTDERRAGLRNLTREEAVEKALLHTFQLSDKDYRKMQAALSEVAFIRALEQDGWTVEALAAAQVPAQEERLDALDIDAMAAALELRDVQRGGSPHITPHNRFYREEAAALLACLPPRPVPAQEERHRASLTLSPSFGPALWLDRRFVARLGASVEDSRITPEEPEPRWYRDALVFVDAVNSAHGQRPPLNLARLSRLWDVDEEDIRAALGVPAQEERLDVAWAEAEAALPEGWHGPSIAQNWLGRWYAYVYQHHENAPADPTITAHVSAEDHDTPAAALQALAARLTEATHD